MAINAIISRGERENLIIFIAIYSNKNPLSSFMKLLLFNQELYPINYLRNTAISYVSTSFIFQLDVDFLPQFGLYNNLMNNINRLNISESDKIALIVPAFETERYR